MDNKTKRKTMETVIWATLVAMNLCGWILVLGPIEPTCKTAEGYIISMIAISASAFLLIIVSTIGFCLMLPDDFFDE